MFKETILKHVSIFFYSWLWQVQSQRVGPHLWVLQVKNKTNGL